MLQPLERELHVRLAEQRIVLRSLELDVPLFVLADVVHVQLLGLPGLQSFANLLGELRGVGSRAKRFASENARGLVVAVAVAGGTLKARADDVGTKRADDAHHVAQRRVVASPLLEGLVGSLGEPEIRYPREALFDAVIAVSRQQFERPQYAQLVEQVAANLVLTALTAIQG